MTKIGINDEKKGEKEELTIPQLVTVDLKPDVPDLQLRVAPKPRGSRCTRTCCLAFFVVLFGLSSLFMAGLFFKHVHRMHRMHEMHDMVFVPAPHRMEKDHVKIDKIKETVYVERTEVDGSQGYTSFHNYQRGFAAHRDDHTQKCYIDKITKTFSEESVEWDTKTDTRRHSAMRTECMPMTKDLLLYMAGQEVVKHCQKYPTYWIYPENPRDFHQGEKHTRPSSMHGKPSLPRKIDNGGLMP